MKNLEFIGSAKEDLASFTPEARRVAGFELRQVQRGLMPADWKPMPEIGPGVVEIRIHLAGAWRVIYVAKFEFAVYVLHAFRKKTKKTSREDIALAASRYRNLGG